MKPVLGMDRVSMFVDGTFSEPRLNHPEAIAIDPEGSVWCGGEEGEIYKIAKDGSTIELMGKTNGFALGIALDSNGYVYVCDMKFACVFRLDPQSKELVRFVGGNQDRSMVCPNYAVVDEQRGFLYVSDSQENGPGVWRFRLDNGEGGLWYDGDCMYANGLAISPEGDEIYLVESYGPKVSKIPIHPDGSTGAKEDVVIIPETVPDGLAFDRQGRLYIACYEPSCIYRYDLSGGKLELLIHDKQCGLLAHPTNIAFRGEHELFSANLGGSHISLIDLGGNKKR